MIGSPYIVVSLIFIGAELSAMQNQILNRQLSSFTHVIIAMTKLLILPGFGYMLVKIAVLRGWMDDPALAMVCLLIFVAPTSANLIDDFSSTGASDLAHQLVISYTSSCMTTLGFVFLAFILL